MMRMNCNIIEDDDDYSGNDCDILVLSVVVKALMMLKKVMQRLFEFVLILYFCQNMTRNVLFRGALEPQRG